MVVDSHDYKFRRVLTASIRLSVNSCVRLVSYIRYFAFAGSTCRVTEEARAVRAARVSTLSVSIITLIASAIRTIKPRPATAESGYGLASYMRDLHK